jgi:hypothetical protein
MAKNLFDFFRLTEKEKKREEKLYIETKKRVRKKDHLWLGKFLEKFSKGEEMPLIRTKNEKGDWL